MKTSFLLALLLAGRVAAADPKADQCKADATALGTFLKDTPHEPHPLLLSRSLTVARRASLASPVVGAPVLNATPREISMQGHLAATRAELATLVRDAAKSSGSKQVVVMLDYLLPWSKVVEIVDVVTAAKLVPVIVFQVEVAVTPPPPSAFDHELAKDKPTKPLSEVVSAVVKPCGALATLWEKLGGEGPPGARTGMILDGITPALIACGCSTDLPSVRSLAWNLIVVRNTATAIILDKPPQKTIALPADTTWSDASKQLEPGVGYRFAVSK